MITVDASSIKEAEDREEAVIITTCCLKRRVSLEMCGWDPVHHSPLQMLHSTGVPGGQVLKNPPAIAA